MKAAPVIAILGVSGAGKSHLSRSIVRARPNILRLSAGTLLRRSLHTTGEKLRTAESQHVRENQLELAHALEEARTDQWDRPVLLEAHSFIDNDRELVDVPTEVMSSLQLAGILLVDASAQKLASRREKDIRKRPHRSVSELELQRSHSRTLAETYAAELGVPMLTVNSSDRSSAVAFVDDILRV